MKQFIKGNKILLAVMAITFIACFIVIGSRINIEKNNNQYDVVLDYSEMVAMADQSDNSLAWWLGKFREMGINKVGIQEESILTLMEEARLPVNGNIMDHVVQQANWQAHYPEEFITKLEDHGWDKFDVLIETDSQEATDFVKEGIETRFNSDKYFMYASGDKLLVVLDGTSDTTLYSEKYKYMNSKNAGFIERLDIESSKLMYISLGLLPEKVKEVQAAGMDVVPRTMSYSGWNDTRFAKAVVAGYDKYHIEPEYIIVGGEAVIGYDDGPEFAKDYILNNGITIGLIENTTQLQNILQTGVEEVAIESGYDTVRVFSVWNYIQNRYQYYGYEGAEEIENTLFRAVTERNIRIIYFKPILENKDLHTYVTDVGDYQSMFSNLETRLSDHGIKFGSATIMGAYQVDKAIKILIAIGCVLGAVLLLKCFLPIRKKAAYILSGVGVLGVLGAYFALPNTAELITSFGAAVVFACLAVTYFTSRSKSCQDAMEQNSSLLSIIKCAGVTLIVAVIIGILGGMMTAAPICSVNYMLEISIFRGVKVAQLLPIVYFAIAYLAYFGYGKSKHNIGGLEFNDIKELLNASIKVWMILLGAVVAGVGVYYIMRTGHDSSIQVSSVEMLFRNKLEDLLMARPRNKEFLFAFPAIMLMVYCSVRRFKLLSILMGLGGVIGMTSVVNTFMHIRTPLYLGFIRTGYSLLFGLIIGVAGILIFEAVYRMYNKYLKFRIEGMSAREEA